MVWTKSTIASQRAAGDADANSSTVCNNAHAECREESFRFNSTNDGNATDANAAVRVPKSRAEGGTGDY